MLAASGLGLAAMPSHTEAPVESPCIFIEGLELDPGVDGAANLRGTLTLTNTREGACGAVVQLYASHPDWEDTPPRLVATVEENFEGNESAIISFPIDARGFATWDADLEGWIVASGIYRITANYSPDHAEGARSFDQEKTLFFPANWKKTD